MAPPLPPKRTTGDYGPTRSPRAEDSYPTSSPIEGAPPWVRSLQAQFDEREGRFYAELALLEKRVNVRRETEAMADMSAKLTMVDRNRSLWRRATVAFGGLAGVTFASCLTRFAAERELSNKAEEVAVTAAEAKAAELTAQHEETRQTTENNSKRIDTLESKLDQVLELLQRPTPIAVPPPGPHKGKHPR